MEKKKYKLDLADSIVIRDHKLYRIIALIDIKGNNVKAGSKGGYIESEKNLSYEGNCWVGDNACVYGDAQVYGNAYVFEDACVSGYAQVYDNARVYGNSQVYGNAQVFENSRVCGDSHVCGGAAVFGSSCVSEDAQIRDNARIFGNALISEYAQIYGDAEVLGNVQVYGNADVLGHTRLTGNARVCEDAKLRSDEDYFCAQSFGSMNRTTTFFKTKEDWLINCGCFMGTVELFRETVVKTHGDSLIAQEYLMIADLAELRIKRHQSCDNLNIDQGCVTADISEMKIKRYVSGVALEE